MIVLRSVYEFKRLRECCSASLCASGGSCRYVWGVRAVQAGREASFEDMCPRNMGWVPWIVYRVTDKLAQSGVGAHLLERTDNVIHTCRYNTYIHIDSHSVKSYSLSLSGNTFILSTTSSKAEAHLLVYQIKEVQGQLGIFWPNNVPN